VHPDRRFYQIWGSLVFLTCTATAVVYPYITAFRGNFDTDYELIIFTLCCEFIMMIDMVVNFLLAFKLEGEEVYVNDLKMIATRYLKGRFLSDFIVWQPFIWLLSDRFNIVLIIKCSRFNRLLNFIDESNILPFIRRYFMSRTQKAMKDPLKAEDQYTDHNNIMESILA